MSHSNIDLKLEVLEASISMHKKMFELKQALEKKIASKSTKNQNNQTHSGQSQASTRASTRASPSNLNTPTISQKPEISPITCPNTPLNLKNDANQQPIYIKKQNKIIRLDKSSPFQANLAQRQEIQNNPSPYIQTSAKKIIHRDVLIRKRKADELNAKTQKLKLAKAKLVARMLKKNNKLLALKASKSRLCHNFLLGNCKFLANSCVYKHPTAPQQIPNCRQFQRNMCKSSSCSYGHVKVNKNAMICRDFVFNQYCKNGFSCRLKHIFECPDFDQYNKCPRNPCVYLHRYNKKSQLNNPEHNSLTAGPTNAFSRLSTSLLTDNNQKVPLSTPIKQSYSGLSYTSHPVVDHHSFANQNNPFGLQKDLNIQSRFDSSVGPNPNPNPKPGFELNSGSGFDPDSNSDTDSIESLKWYSD